MSTPILGYWDIRGLCHPIRYLLAYLGIDYEEKLYPVPGSPNGGEEWFADKYSLGLQFPNIPYWIDGEVKLTESKAILRHLARENCKSLIPEDAADARLADMLESLTGELMYSLLLGYCWRIDNEAEKTRLKGNYNAKLKELSEFLDNKLWILGEKMTYVDFLLYETLYLHSTFDKECILPFANFGDYMKRFENIPSIAEYIASPGFIKGPCNSTLANHHF